jgi:DNA ligase-1
MMLANRYAGQEVGGWWMGEKFDGVRAYWDGAAIRTRTWREVQAPAWFLAKLPRGVAIDGELWGGRGTFQIASELSRFARADDAAWQGMRLMAFDWPTCDAIGYEDRLARLAGLENDVVQVARVCRCGSGAEAVARMRAIVSDGGEGVVLKRPGHCYEFGRSSAWLKVKPGEVD